MEVSAKLDWLTLTVNDERHEKYKNVEIPDFMSALDAARWYLSDIGCKRLILETAPAGRGYHYGFSVVGSDIRISLSRDMRKQGAMIVLSASALEGLSDARLWLANAFDLGWRASRVDVAFDVYDSGVSAGQVASEYAAASENLPRRKTTVISSPKGDTFYVGSRMSPRMLRVYDKGRQQRTSLDWLRLELEIKGRSAHEAGRKLVADPASGASWVSDMLVVDVGGVLSAINELASGSADLEYSSPRARTNRGAWFMTTVLAAFEGLVKDDPETALEFYDALVGRISSRRSVLESIVNI